MYVTKEINIIFDKNFQRVGLEEMYLNITKDVIDRLTANLIYSCKS